MCMILAIGHDEELLNTRSAVLRRCNAGVIAARPSEAIEILKAGRFDLVVLCHTLSTADMKKLVSLAHQQASDIQVLEILSASAPRWERACSGADDTALSNPASLVAKVIEMCAPVRISLKAEVKSLSRLG
jgi:DNA-binding response OmpR family regulator